MCHVHIYALSLLQALKTDIPQGLYQQACSPPERLIRQVVRSKFVDGFVISVDSRLGLIGEFDHVAVNGDGLLLERNREFERLRDLGSDSTTRQSPGT